MFTTNVNFLAVVLLFSAYFSEIVTLNNIFVMVNNIIFEFAVCSVYFEWCDGMLIQIYVVNEIKPDIFIQTKVRLKKTYVLVWISSIWIH